MKKVLMVIANEGFRDEEYLEPKDILQNNGISVVTAALKAGEAHGSQGAKVRVDIEVEALLSDKERWKLYDAIIFIGGAGTQLLLDNEKFHQLAQNFNSEKKIVAAICVAPLILAKAGLLHRKDATVYPSQEFIDALVNLGAEYINEDVVVTDNIITAAGPKAAYKFGMMLVKKLV